MRKMLFSALFALLVFFLSFTSQAQTDFQKNSINIGAGIQWGNGLGVRPALNAGYERKFSFHSSIETGFNYLNLKVTTLANSSTATAKKEYYHLFTLPILYKLHTNIVDIAAGPSLNLISGPSPSSTSPVSFQKDPGKIAIGYAFKVSKPIPLNDRLSLVPEAGIQGNQYFKRPQGGVNIGLKFGL